MYHFLLALFRAPGNPFFLLLSLPSPSSASSSSNFLQDEEEEETKMSEEGLSMTDAGKCVRGASAYGGGG